VKPRLKVRFPRPHWPHRPERTTVTDAALPAPGAVLRVFRVTALAAIATVITAASSASFAESYRGLWLWARHHGLSGFWAAVFPLQVDAFIVTGELTLFVAMADRWSKRDRAGAWLVALLGLAASTAGNVGHVAAHDLQSRGTAAVPPLAAFAALWVGLGVLKRVVSQQHADTPETILALPVPGVPANVWEAAKAAYIASVRGTNPLSERALADRFGISRTDARKLRAEVAAAGNGHGAGDPALN
jgi:lysylphosphatidylglycerol synthetase-like protein (DUF2156 family)